MVLRYVKIPKSGSKAVGLVQILLEAGPATLRHEAIVQVAREA
jgi:hypothetical protein